MDIIGIDIAKAKFDVALVIGERIKHAAFSNTEAGFEQLLTWLAKHRPDPEAPLHACMEATGNWVWTWRLSCIAAVSGSASSTRRASRPSVKASWRATRPISSTQA